MQPSGYQNTLAQYYQFHLLAGENLADVNANAQAAFPGLSPQTYYAAAVAAQQGITATANIEDLADDQRLNMASTRRPRPTGPVRLRFLATFENAQGQQSFQTVYVTVDWTDTKAEALDVAEQEIGDNEAQYGLELTGVQLVPTIY